MLTNSFRKPLPIVSPLGNTQEGGETATEAPQSLSQTNRRELKKRSAYLAASMPLILLFLYLAWMLYDAWFVYRGMRIDVEAATVMIEHACNRDALKLKGYSDDVISSTLQSSGCIEAKRLGDCDQVDEFDARWIVRRSAGNHWFSGDYILLRLPLYWLAANILCNPAGLMGGLFFLYYVSRRFWIWVIGPCIKACRDIYHAPKISAAVLPTMYSPHKED